MSKKHPKHDVDDYAARMIPFHEWCEAYEVNFRDAVASLGELLIKLLPLPSARGPAAPPDDGEGVVRLLKAAAAAPTREPPPPRERREHPPRERRPNPSAGAPGRWLAMDDFPGRLFTARQVRAACGVEARNLRPWIERGTKVGGRHVVRYATEHEIDAALGPAAVPKPSPGHPRKGVRP